MSKNSEFMAESCASELVRMFACLDKFDWGENISEKSMEAFWEGTSQLTDPDTGESFWWDEGFGFVKEVHIHTILAGGGPAMRIKSVYRGGEHQWNELQHQDWFERWTTHYLTTEEQEAIDRYVEAIDPSFYLEE